MECRIDYTYNPEGSLVDVQVKAPNGNRSLFYDTLTKSYDESKALSLYQRFQPDTISMLDTMGYKLELDSNNEIDITLDYDGTPLVTVTKNGQTIKTPLRELEISLQDLSTIYKNAELSYNVNETLNDTVERLSDTYGIDAEVVSENEAAAILGDKHNIELTDEGFIVKGITNAKELNKLNILDEALSPQEVMSKLEELGNRLGLKIAVNTDNIFVRPEILAGVMYVNPSIAVDNRYDVDGIIENIEQELIDKFKVNSINEVGFIIERIKNDKAFISFKNREGFRWDYLSEFEKLGKVRFKKGMDFVNKVLTSEYHMRFLNPYLLEMDFKSSNELYAQYPLDGMFPQVINTLTGTFNKANVIIDNINVVNDFLNTDLGLELLSKYESFRNLEISLEAVKTEFTSLIKQFNETGDYNVFYGHNIYATNQLLFDKVLYDLVEYLLQDKDISYADNIPTIIGFRNLMYFIDEYMRPPKRDIKNQTVAEFDTEKQYTQLWMTHVEEAYEKDIKPLLPSYLQGTSPVSFFIPRNLENINSLTDEELSIIESVIESQINHYGLGSNPSIEYMIELDMYKELPYLRSMIQFARYIRKVQDDQNAPSYKPIEVNMKELVKELKTIPTVIDEFKSINGTEEEYLDKKMLEYMRIEDMSSYVKSGELFTEEGLDIVTVIGAFGGQRFDDYVQYWEECWNKGVGLQECFSTHPVDWQNSTDFLKETRKFSTNIYKDGSVTVKMKPNVPVYNYGKYDIYTISNDEKDPLLRNFLKNNRNQSEKGGYVSDINKIKESIQEHKQKFKEKYEVNHDEIVANWHPAYIEKVNLHIDIPHTMMTPSLIEFIKSDKPLSDLPSDLKYLLEDEDAEFYLAIIQKTRNVKKFAERWGFAYESFIYDSNNDRVIIDSIESKPKEYMMQLDEDITIKGFYDTNSNKAYIVEGKADETTPIHEIFSHAFIAKVQVENPALYNNLVKEAMSNEKIKDLINRAYKGMSAETKEHEAIAAAIDMYYKQLLDMEKDKSLIEYLKEFFKFVSDNFMSLLSLANNNFSSIDENTTLKDIAAYVKINRDTLDLSITDKIATQELNGIKFQKNIKPSKQFKKDLESVSEELNMNYDDILSVLNDNYEQQVYLQTGNKLKKYTENGYGKHVLLKKNTKGSVGDNVDFFKSNDDLIINNQSKVVPLNNEEYVEPSFIYKREIKCR